MPEIPECLNRRYQALDELIKELSSSMSAPNSNMESGESENVGVKMMCDFWNILKENPSCNLKREVEERMCPKRSYYNSFGPRRVTCYMAGQAKKDDNDKNRENLSKVKNSCCRGTAPQPEQKDKCCASKSVSPSIGSDALPLSKVLCNLKEAASFDRKCQARVNDLMETQKMLQEQIQHLEHREKEGIQLLKQADCMWSCMEDAYKKKIAESLERQKTLLKQLKEVETSATKWRKNKKDLELQMDSVNKFQQEIIEKTHQKTNDIKCLDTEIEDFKKRIEGNKKDAETAKKSINIKKNASNAKVAAIANDITRVQKQLQEEKRNKMLKEQEGANYIKEAREDLQKICRVLLQRKLENEDLKAEKEALVLEIDMLKQVCEQCSEKCKVKQESINEEIRKLELEIANFKVKCIRCHECTDTADVRKFCSDCPRCVEERDCLYKDGHCNPDHTMDCVCMTVKHKFLDNVFDNMYTVLERQTKTNSGKMIADVVMNCLKRSRNGKLNEETRKLVQEFILTTVKKNLNLTIVGGAVKTRCEMDPETYKQLMLCLKQVKVSRPPKVDKGTVAKKEVCRRWGGTGECNCPKGPKACICLKKAPPPPGDPTPCPQDPEDKEAGQIKACPHKESTACGTDCAMHTAPDCVGTEIASKRPDPCQGQSCPFSKNMRAAQCVLGPESLSSIPVPKASRILNDVSCLDNEVLCSCGNTTKVPCVCPTDIMNRPRDRMIEEVMGRYAEITPIEKVKTVNEINANNHKEEYFYHGHSRHKNKMAPSASIKEISQYCTCSPNYIAIKRNQSVGQQTIKKIYVCQRPEDFYSSNDTLFLSFDYSRDLSDFKSTQDVELTLISCPNFNKPVHGTPSTSYNDFRQQSNKKAMRNIKAKSARNSSNRLHGRNIQRNTVKDIVKDIVMCDATAKRYKYSSKVQLVSVKSFLKEVISRTKICASESDATTYEKEIANSILNPEDYTKTQHRSSPVS